jgi:hypothetical protein
VLDDELTEKIFVLLLDTVSKSLFQKRFFFSLSMMLRLNCGTVHFHSDRSLPYTKVLFFFSKTFLPDGIKTGAVLKRFYLVDVKTELFVCVHVT